MAVWDALRQALRTVRRNLRRSLISISATAFGVALTLLMLGIADGTYNQLVHDATRLQSGNVTVQHPSYLESSRVEDVLEHGEAIRGQLAALSGVEQVKPLILGEALARSGVDAAGAALFGLDPAAERATSPLADKIVHGEFLLDGDEGLALIGVDMAERLDLQVGSKFVISANDVQGDIRAVLMHVRGIFRTGDTSMDGFAILAPLATARELYGLGDAAVTRLAVVLENVEDQDRVLTAALPIARRVGGRAYPWQTIEPALAGYIRLDRGSGLVFAFILIGISLFTIFNTVLMSVLERRREIAVRFALGTPRRTLAMQLFFECLTYGLVGCGLGAAIAVAILLPYVEPGMDLSAMYGAEQVDVASFAISTVIHPAVELTTIGSICGLVTVMTVLTAAPALAFLARLNIVEELRA